MYQFALDPNLSEHRRHISALADAGIKPSRRWTTLNQQLTDFLGLESQSLDRLCDAVTDPKAGTDLAVLRAIALADIDARPPSAAKVSNTVQVHVLRLMREDYAIHAEANYDKARKMFDTAAGELSAAAKSVDIELAADAAIKLGSRDQEVWKSAESHAARLNSLVPALISAAALAGTQIVNNPEHMLPLVADMAGHHKRRMWEALAHKGGRCGRWSKLLELGVRLRACPLDQYEPCSAPRPLEYRQVQAPGQPHGIVRTEVIDPEDGAVEPIDPVRRHGQVTMV